MSDDAAVSAEPPAPPIRWAILFGVWTAYFCFGLTIAGLAPLIGPITRDLEISHTAMGAVLGIWQLTYIVAAVPCGSFLDRVGARRAIFLGAMIVALSGLLRGIADSAALLFVAVAIFGIGGPIVSAGAPKEIARWFKGSDRGFAMGIYITGPAIGSIVALSLTNSVLMPYFGGDWRAVLLLWSAVAALGACTWFAIASLPAARRHDPPASTTKPRPQKEVIGELVRLPAVRLLLAMSVAIFALNHGLNNWLPEILRVGGMTPVEAGYWATVPTLIGILASLTIPRLATPERRHLVLGLLAAGAVLACLLLWVSGQPALTIGLALQGIARSSLMTVAILTLVETKGVGEERAGTASGLFFSAAEVGGAGGPILLGLVYDATHSFDLSLWILAGVAGFLLLGTMRLRALQS